MESFFLIKKRHKNDKKLPKQNMGKSNLGWLQSRFHFSFAEYRNPKNINILEF